MQCSFFLLHRNQMDELWSVTDEDDGDVSEYQDAFGDTQAERMQPIPPRDMREHGLSASAHRLAVHTGEKRWASKGGDVPATDNFDTDLANRAGDLFSAASRVNFAPRVSLKRDGMQDAPEREDEGRNDLYHGFNERLTRQMKTLIPTRRGTTPLDVVGYEKRDSIVTAPPTQAQVTEVIRAGAHEPTSHRVGVANGVMRGSVATSDVHMGAQGISAMRPTGTMTGSNDAIAWQPELHEGTRRGEGDTGDVANRVTRLKGQEAAAHRADAPLSRYDSTTSMARGSTVVVHERRAQTSDVIVGNADSTSTLAPRRLTFDQVAAQVSARVAVGVRDSTSNIGWDVKRTGNVHSAPTKPGDVTMRRSGPVEARTGAPRFHDSEYTRALSGVRARDRSGDSRRIERVVANVVHENALVAADTARRFRENGEMRTRDATRTHNTVVGRAMDAMRRMVVDRTEFRDPTTASSAQTGLQRPLVARHALSKHEDVIGRTGPETQMYVQDPVYGTVERRWGNDGTVSASHVPVSTGISKNAASSSISDRGGMGVRSTETPMPRRAANVNAPRPPPPGSEERRGRRD